MSSNIGNANINIIPGGFLFSLYVFVVFIDIEIEEDYMQKLIYVGDTKKVDSHPSQIVDQVWCGVTLE
jgi:hypothetical protein